MIRLTRRYHFVASHRLHSPQLSEAENDTTYGKCNNPFGHGHNYTLEVTVANPVHSETGQAVPVPALDALIQEQVLSRYDHRNLNEELDEYKFGLVPTTENVLACIEEKLREIWPPRLGSLVRLRLHETANNTFESTLS